jgi:hypothetical protein
MIFKGMSIRRRSPGSAAAAWHSLIVTTTRNVLLVIASLIRRLQLNCPHCRWVSDFSSLNVIARTWMHSYYYYRFQYRDQQSRAGYSVAIVPEPEIHALILAGWRGWFYRSIFAMNRLRKNSILLEIIAGFDQKALQAVSHFPKFFESLFV